MEKATCMVSTLLLIGGRDWGVTSLIEVSKPGALAPRTTAGKLNHIIRCAEPPYRSMAFRVLPGEFGINTEDPI